MTDTFEPRSFEYTLEADDIVEWTPLILRGSPAHLASIGRLKATTLRWAASLLGVALISALVLAGRDQLLAPMGWWLILHNLLVVCVGVGLLSLMIASGLAPEAQEKSLRAGVQRAIDADHLSMMPGMRISVVFDEGGASWDAGPRSGRTRWDGFLRVAQSERQTMLIDSDFGGVSIPRRVFEDQQAYDRFVIAVRARIDEAGRAG